MRPWRKMKLVKALLSLKVTAVGWSVFIVMGMEYQNNNKIIIIAAAQQTLSNTYYVRHVTNNSFTTSFL